MQNEKAVTCIHQQMKNSQKKNQIVCCQTLQLLQLFLATIQNMCKNLKNKNFYFIGFYELLSISIELSLVQYEIVQQTKELILTFKSLSQNNLQLHRQHFGQFQSCKIKLPLQLSHFQLRQMKYIKKYFITQRLFKPFKRQQILKNICKFIILKQTMQKSQNSKSKIELISIKSSKFDEDTQLLNGESKIMSNFDTMEFQSPMTKINARNPKKLKPISKGRTRIMKSNSKWSPRERTQYFKSMVKLNRQYVSIGISWTFWKPEKTFNFISDIMKTKTNRQVKSFDQCMKREFLENKGIDLIPAAIQELQKVKNNDDPQVQQLLDSHYKLQKEESQHMALIQKKMSIVSQVDDMLQQLKKQMAMYQNRGSSETIFMDQE